MNPLSIMAEVTGLAPAARGIFRLTVLAPQLASQARPGQFLMVGPLLQGGEDPFLNRPLSIHEVGRDGSLGLLVAQVGRGTDLMAQLGPGNRIGLLGPLGTGFYTPPQTGRAVLVAGGVGVAPLFFLARELRGQGLPCSLLYGAAQGSALVDTKALQTLGVDVQLATDDGSSGHHGFVSDLLQETLGSVNGEAGPPAWVACCGPAAMMKTVTGICRKASVPVQVSLENRMACGTGACMGCSEFVSGRPQRVCVEGPVFDGREVFG